MRILTIVETAYRATLEEQDDTILWLTRALRNAGAELSVVLRGNAVNYAIRQACPTLAIGKATITHPAQPNDDLVRLRAKGCPVYVVREDLAERGIDARAVYRGGRARRTPRGRRPAGAARPHLALVSRPTAAARIGSTSREGIVNNRRHSTH
jgi:hypothetical protein